MQAYTLRPSQLHGISTAAKQLLPGLPSVYTSLICLLCLMLLTSRAMTTTQQGIQQLLLHARGRLSLHAAWMGSSVGCLSTWGYLLRGTRGVIDRWQPCPCTIPAHAPRYSILYFAIACCGYYALVLYWGVQDLVDTTGIWALSAMLPAVECNGRQFTMPVVLGMLFSTKVIFWQDMHRNADA